MEMLAGDEARLYNFLRRTSERASMFCSLMDCRVSSPLGCDEAGELALLSQIAAHPTNVGCR